MAPLFVILSSLRAGSRDTTWQKLSASSNIEERRKAFGHRGRPSQWCFEPVSEHGPWSAAITSLVTRLW